MSRSRASLVAGPGSRLGPGVGGARELWQAAAPWSRTEGGASPGGGEICTRVRPGGTERGPTSKAPERWASGRPGPAARG
eukprot:8567042-Pyramimonas_sp.AAC.1